MLIKIDNPEVQLPTQLTPLYLFIGEEPFLLADFHKKLHRRWKEYSEENDHFRFFIEKPSDWAQVQQEYSQYTLFSTARFIDLRYSRAKLDKEGSACLLHYLETKPPETLMLIQAPLLTLKQIQKLQDKNNLTIIQFSSPREKTLFAWIKRSLQEKEFTLDQGLPERIAHYTQGNLLACSQFIEKISFSLAPKSHLSIETIEAQLFPQGHYSLFEWAQAFLDGNLEKSLLVLDYLLDTKTEPTLLLWILSQEIHQCIQFLEQQQKLGSFQAASKHLKFWPSKAARYQTFLKRKPLSALLKILADCHQLDLCIKNNQGESRVYTALAQLVLACCVSTSHKERPLA